MALKFYINMAKRLKLIVKNFCGLIPTFLEVTGEKLVGALLAQPPPPHPEKGQFWLFRPIDKNIYVNIYNINLIFSRDCKNF